VFNESNSRYRGNPLLLLFEKYLLWCTGELPPQSAASMEGITPRLQATHRRGGNWQSILAAELRHSEELPDEVRRMWVNNQDLARKNGLTVTAQQFAEMFVDENFVPAMEPDSGSP
jgi:hypothetical protein